MSWTREQVSRLIDLYQANSILYMPTNPAYYNKAARNEVLIKISKELGKIRPNTSADAIKSKINTLRSQFNKERGNFRKIIQNGASTDEAFKPSLWCFDRLLFLQDAPSARPSGCNIKMEGLYEEYIPNDTEIQELHKVKFEEIEVHPDPLATSASACTSATNITATSFASKEDEIDSLNCWPQTRKRKRIPSQSTDDEVLLEIKDAITSLTNKSAENANANEWEIFSKFICSEIQSMKMERNKRILKREIIQCILKRQMLEEEEMNDE